MADGHGLGKLCHKLTLGASGGRRVDLQTLAAQSLVTDDDAMTDEDTAAQWPAASLQAARAQWRWRGRERPPFAHTPGTGQESVWDYPRPPVLAKDAREVVIRWGGVEIARTSRAIRVLETAHPPSFYLPWDDVARGQLRPAAGTSLCEWKG